MTVSALMMGWGVMVERQRRASTLLLPSPGPARRNAFRARLAVAPRGHPAINRLAAALACGPGPRERPAFAALWRPDDAARLPPSCAPGGASCVENPACWRWLVEGEGEGAAPRLRSFASAAAARAAAASPPDALDAVLVFQGGTFELGVNATLLPDAAAATPAPGGAPAPQRRLWFSANLAAAAAAAAAGAPVAPSFRFKPFPWPPPTTDAAAAGIAGAMRLLVAYGGLPLARRAAASLAGEASSGARAALAAAGLPPWLYWGSWAAVHGGEAALGAAALGAGAVAGGAAAPAAALLALLAFLATAAVVASAYAVAAAAGTAGADYYPLGFIVAALPGYAACSSGAPTAVWALSLLLPPSAAVVAGSAGSAAVVAARAGRPLLSEPVAAAPGAPPVWAVALALAALAPAAAAVAAAVEWALAPTRAPLAEGGGGAADAETTPPAAVADGLVVAYGAARALDGASFVAPTRSVTALLGPNGAGKTTAMSVLTGRVTPSAGAAAVAGKRVGARGVAGVCPQADAAAWEVLTVREHLRLFAAARRAPHPGAAAAASATSFGLAQKLDARASELSGGQRRRLVLACATVGGAAVLLLDEPTAGLDADARAAAWAALLDPRASGAPVGDDSGVLVTTHNLEEVDALATTVVVVARGAVVAAGTPAGVRAAAGGGVVLSVSVDGDTDARLDAVGEELARLAPGAAPARRGAWRLPAGAPVAAVVHAIAARPGVTGVGLSAMSLDDAVLQLSEAGGEPTPALALLPPPPTPLTGPRLALSRLSALLARHSAAASRSWRREGVDAALAAVTLALGATLAAAGGPSLARVAMGPLRGALVGAAPGVGGVAAFAAAFGGPAAEVAPGATTLWPDGAGSGPGRAGPDTLDAALLRRGGGPPLAAAAFLGAASTTLLTNQTAPHALLAAVVAGVGAATRALNATTPPPPFLAPLPPGPTAVAARAADALGAWIFALQLASAAGAAGAAAARRAAGDRTGGADLQERLAGAAPAARVVARALAEGARSALWLGAGLAATAALGPPDLAAPAPLLAMAALGGATAAATLGQGALAAAFTDRDTAGTWPASAGWTGALALAVCEGLAVAPLLWPARARALAAARRAAGAAAAALLPGFNLMRGVLAAALPTGDEGGPRAPLSWAAAGAPLAALVCQAAAAWLAVWAVAASPPGAFKLPAWPWRRQEAAADPAREPLLAASSPAPVAPARERVAVETALAASAPWPLLVADAAVAFPGPGATPVHALAGAWLRVGPGECVAVVGANGAGKTTLFRAVAGELALDRGRVLVGGVPAGRARGLVSYCPQSGGPSDALSPREAVTLASRLRGASRSDAATEASSLLAAVGLAGPTADRPIKALSGGQARRAAVAAALAGSPALVVLDEPTAGLDAASRVAVWAAVAARARARGGGVLVSTHRFADVEAAATRVVLLARGSVAAAGAPQALRDAAGGGTYAVTVAPVPTDPAAAALSTALGPAATPLPAAPGEARWRVPATDGAGVAALYEALEKVRNAGGVARFSVEAAALEDALAAVVGGERGA